MQIRTVRRWVAAVAWGALAVATAGCGQGAYATSSTGAAAPATYAGITDLPEALAADGTTITVGDPLAKTVVRLYEDPRCPVVVDFESTGAKAIRAQTFKRQVRTEYTLASFKDVRLGGDGSKRAVNALRAALDGQRFAEYHAVLMDNQTVVEESGGFTTERLLELAEQVPGLRGEAFDTAVSTMKYQDFVTASQSAYEHTGDDPIGPGTPSFAIDSKLVPEEFRGLFFEERLAEDLLTLVRTDPAGWQKYHG
ncbi:DsbA family protein [Streptomyces sp. NRRL S-237]|uniref:DsbA family protein n=1 Tax=Streptomyces sp. NRRL S-237 TaxID=1463895 RepID=UPI000566CF25|nr:thioredoxin domain-containing protein [Streptomyces sp. NRRL S-237]